ncbi:hypothetical protein ABS648_08880 [Pseudomonas solani]|uniref:Solute-binding protein family 3/N-terminal domain-containing protein n=1 Tax=Pseudomonas solani TaxID=2731552 RepID=A0AAU7YA65_9PSED
MEAAAIIRQALLHSPWLRTASLALLLVAGIAQADPPLRLSFIANSTLFHEDDGGRDEIARLFASAGVATEVVTLPAKRIVWQMQYEPGPHCSVGWIRTREREGFARFSLPIRPPLYLEVVTNRRALPQVSRYASLRALMAAPGLRLGVSDGFSYGEELDRRIADMGEAALPNSQAPINQLRLLASNRFDYTLADPYDFRWAMSHPSYAHRELVSLVFPDMPPGRPRHLMCSRSVPEATVQRIDQAIRAMGLDRGS